MPNFIPGLELSRLYYREVVQPILNDHFPGLEHAAALIGPGSEVLDFDTEMSMDHHWYPNVEIFIQESDKALSSQIHETLRWRLPPTFMNFPLHLEEIPDEPGVFLMVPKDTPPFEHNIFPQTVGEFKAKHLGWEEDHKLTAADCLSTPSQLLRSITSGAVHHDDFGQLSELRRQLEWYPQDVWLYLMAAGWYRIGEEEHLMPRAGYVGDELGSTLIGSRLVRDIMSLCFLMEKQYAPYPKWFGTAFQQLECAETLHPVLLRALSAKSWQQREFELSAAYHVLAEMHNQLGITKPLPSDVSDFHKRPFKVIHGDRFGDAILNEIKGQEVIRISRQTKSGGIDMISDNTNFCTDLVTRKAIDQLYQSTASK